MKRLSFVMMIATTAIIFVWTLGGMLSPVAKMQTVYNVTEGFDSGGKTSYAVADVTFPSGSWNLSDALTGNLDGRCAHRNYGVRVRNSGIVSMNFNAGSAGCVFRSKLNSRFA